MTKIGHYNKFVGKVCTILTQQVSFPFRDPKQYAEFFTGLVTEVNEQGIFIKHLNTNTLAFYEFPLVGIIEEQVVSKNDPNYDKIKDEIKKKNPIAQKPPSNFMPVDELSKMAKQIKANRSNTQQSSSNT